MAATLYHVHDPMCSWCWGYRPTWELLRSELPAQVKVINVVGGLAPDSDEPMPLKQQELIASYWRNIAEELGTEFNFDFWTRCTPRRSTYPACRGVLAARRQDAEEDMIKAIQHAYYLRAMNPSDASTLVALADEINIDSQLFAEDLASPGLQSELEEEFALRRSLQVRVFPSLVIRIDESSWPVPLDYLNHLPGLAFIRSKLANPAPGA